jgi:hypothetical protein
MPRMMLPLNSITMPAITRMTAATHNKKPMAAPYPDAGGVRRIWARE